MIANIQYKAKNFQIDLSKPLDISIPMRASKSNVNAWYLGEPKIESVTNVPVVSVNKILLNAPLLVSFHSTLCKLIL